MQDKPTLSEFSERLSDIGNQLQTLSVVICGQNQSSEKDFDLSRCESEENIIEQPSDRENAKPAEFKFGPSYGTLVVWI